MPAWVAGSLTDPKLLEGPMVSAVVLAAGESKRMKDKKEVLPIVGEPMIRTVVGWR